MDSEGENKSSNIVTKNEPKDCVEVMIYTFNIRIITNFINLTIDSCDRVWPFLFVKVCLSFVRFSVCT